MNARPQITILALPDEGDAQAEKIWAESQESFKPEMVSFRSAVLPLAEKAKEGTLTDFFYSKRLLSFPKDHTCMSPLITVDLLPLTVPVPRGGGR